TSHTSRVAFSEVVRREWRYDLALLIGTRLVLFVVGLLALAIVPIGFRQIDLMPHLPALDMWAQWDAQHYVDIAVRGYDSPYAPESNIAFFPLYPLLIRVVLLALGRVDTQTGAFIGLVISNVALFGALLYLSALVARDFSLTIARRTVLYVLVFPTTLFLSSVYAEPVFLLAAVASLYHARAGQWGRSSVCGALAALTRPFGVLLLVPMAVELYRQHARLRSWLWLVGPPVGLALFVGYLWWLFGDPFAYFQAGTTWGRGLHAPWDVLLGYIKGPIVMFDWPYSWLDLISMIAMVAILIAGIRLVPPSYSSYSAAGLIFAMSTGVAWFSASRHALALFPLIIVLALIGWRYRWFNWAWLAFSIFIALAFMVREAVGYWVT
ncbi:MAG TPA: mannosyltransferase family protein, partial [Candidatus Limnocylindrales bacterium]